MVLLTDLAGTAAFAAGACEPTVLLGHRATLPILAAQCASWVPTWVHACSPHAGRGLWVTEGSQLWA